MHFLVGLPNRMRTIFCIIAVSSATAVALAAAIALWFYDTRSAGAATRAVLVGAGDIASCSSGGDAATAKLLDGIGGTVFTVGDHAYPEGTAAQFKNCYGPTWGRHKGRTRPTVGNHDYNTAGAAGYFGYFGARAGDRQKGYYSYDRGQWHIVALNSNCPRVRGCGGGSAQLQWLRNDLKRNSGTPCTLAYWHHARFSSGEHGNDPRTAPFWEALYNHHADVIVSGHDHDYERFALQAPNGTRDQKRGIREFVVGTGGGRHYPFESVKANSQVRNATTNGVLKLTLGASSYQWKFVPEAGKTFTDSGTAKCR
jgi:hypothetical protein